MLVYKIPTGTGCRHQGGGLPLACGNLYHFYSVLFIDK